MKEKILQALKSVHTGFAQSTYDGVATYLSKSVTEESAIDDAVKDVIPLLKSFQAETDRLNFSLKKENEALKAKYEQKKDDEAKGSEDEKKDKPAPDKDMPEWAKALAESINKISEKQTQFEAEKQSQTLTQSLTAKLKGKEVPESFYKTVIAGRTFKDEAEVDAFVETVSTGYTEHLTELQKQNPGFGRPQKPTGPSDQVPDIIKEKVEQVKTGAAPKPEGLIGKQLK